MQARPRRRPSPDREARRQKIISVAIKLFAEQGLENVTYGHIARAAKLSRPLVYFYFPDLETLFMAALIVGTKSVLDRFQAAVHPEQRGLEQIMAIGRAYVALSREEPAQFQLLAYNETKQSGAHEEHPLEAQCRPQYEAIMNLLISALRKGVRDGSIRRDIGDPGRVAIALWGLTHGLIQLAATKEPSIVQKLGGPFAGLPDFGLDLLARSLRAEPPRRA